MAHETMRTYRMVAETDHGLVCVDVVLRGTTDGIKALALPVRRFLDFDCGFAGSWVDQGTERDSVTFSVAPRRRCPVTDSLCATPDLCDDAERCLAAIGGTL